MRLASYVLDGVESYGIIMPNDKVIDVRTQLGSEYPTLLALLRAEALDKARALEDSDSTVSLSDVKLQRPIPFPEKIFCIGVNYGKRNEEYQDGSDAPKYPSMFVRTPDSLVAHGENIVRPPESERLDYEGEIVIVIGKAGRRIKPENVRDHIAGLTIMNEGTIRDWLRHGKFNVTQGKNFGASGSLGPWMVTADEFPDFNNLSVETRINGEVRQKDTTANMVFNFDYLLPYMSKFMEFKPGDIIATGTPTGAGTFFDPPKWLVPGDVIEVEVSGIGTLRNEVVDEVV
ncbi:MAG: fumarylacetoacetate hydrolase family protein [Rhodospirillaceae bacterium]|jgi:2-keto-4-pentenoate hydratase/2-oxohepta-3-ene-1,7-dioic acid hydratase in catechol pathway